MRILQLNLLFLTSLLDVSRGLDHALTSRLTCD
jgi:hypothetical protein